MSSTPTSPFAFCNNSDDDARHHQYQQHDSSPSTSSSLSTKQNSLLTVHDIIHMTPHESEVETMIFNNIQQHEAAEKKKYHGQSPIGHNTKHSIFHCIPDESLRYYIGKNTDTDSTAKQRNTIDDENADKQQQCQDHHRKTSAFTSVVQKPDTIERRARSDTLNISSLTTKHHLTTTINKTPLRSNRTTATITTAKHLHSNDTRKSNLPPLARSTTMTSSNSHNHRYLTKTPSQRRHRHSNSSTSTTLGTMAQQLDEYQNNNSHQAHEHFQSNSPSSSSLQSKISFQSKHPTTKVETIPIIPSAVEMMVVPPRMSTGQRPISPLTSKDDNVLKSSSWSLNDSDDDCNDQDSLLLNPKSPPQDIEALDVHDTTSEMHFPSSNNTIDTTSSILTPKAVSDWIKKRKPAKITVTTVEHDSDNDDNNKGDAMRLVPANIKLSSDDDDVEWGKTVQNLLSPNSVPVSPHISTSTTDHLAQESRIFKSMEWFRRCRYAIVLCRTPTSFHDLWYDFEIFVRQRQKMFVRYLRYFLLIVIPAIIIAFILFYIAGTFYKGFNDLN